jgi:tRNA(adenine34) deaminase
MSAQKRFMRAAIAEAEKGKRGDDYGVGAVVVRKSRVIARASNRTKRDQNQVAHAEVLAIQAAARKLGRRHLSECTIYTTHEPCPMCAGAIVFARLKGVVYGARYRDMERYAKKNATKHFSWKTVDMSCELVLKKSRTNIVLVKDFMRKECNALFHNGN